MAIDVSYLLQLIFNGLATGSIYVLVALGMTLMFGVLGVPNFAHGQVYMLGAYFTWIGTSNGLPFWPSLVGAILLTAVVGIAMERLAFNPVSRRGGELIAHLLAAFALYVIIGSVVEIVWGPTGRGMRLPVTGAILVENVIMTKSRLLLIGTTIVMIVLLHVLVQYTRFGKAMRALSQNEAKARTVGINRDRISILTFGIGSGMAGLAGGLLGAMFGLNPYMGLDVVLKAFVIIVIGGLGSMFGAIVGGFGLGIAENVATGYLANEFSTIIAFSILFVFLIFRPYGLFGEGLE